MSGVIYRGDISSLQKLNMGSVELKRTAIVDAILDAGDLHDGIMSDLLSALYTEILQKESSDNQRVRTIEVPLSTGLSVKNFLDRCNKQTE